ncbi:MAG: hypothetical protein E7473_09085 [Ruminococcaceae bacterium]|nr:hypothetical protein [Oscillospiraceae bacterium]
MKRLISAILTVAMLISFVPVFAAESSGVKVIYDPSVLEYNVNIADISYELTNSFYSYHSRKEGWEPAHGDFRINGDPNKGMLAYHHTAGDWYAMELNVPAAGEYDVTIECIKRTYGANKAYIYFLDETEAENIEENLTEENKFSENSFFSESNYKEKEIASGTVEFPNAGKYLFVVQGTEKWTYTTIGKIILDGGSGTAPMGSVVSCDKSVIAVGEKATASAKLFYSDGGEAVLYPDEKTYESSDESVATVDAYGNITAISEGSTEITATVTWGGREFVSKTSIKVIKKTTNIKIHYDFIDNYTEDVPYTTSETTFIATHKSLNLVDAYEKTFGLWKLASAPSGLSVNHCYTTANAYNLGLRAYFNGEKKWFAINIRVPVKGEYKVIFGYNCHSSFEPALETYLIDGEASDSEITSAIADGTGALAVVNCTKGNANGTQLTEIGTRELDAGEYTVIFNSPNAKNIRIHNLELVSGTGDKYALLSADMELVGNKKLAVTGKLADAAMSMADMSEAEVVYEGKNPDIATVAADGSVKVLKEGELTVIANITYGEMMLTVEKTFNVAPAPSLAPAEVSQRYDFLTMSPDWDAPMYTQEPKRTEDIRMITYDYTDGNWQWHSTDVASFPNAYSDVAWMYRGEPYGRLRLGFNPGYYVALAIKVPKAGRYFASIERNDHSQSVGAGDVYVLPMTNDVKTALAGAEPIGNVNCYNPDVSDYTPTYQDLGVVEFPEAGEYILAVKKTQGHGAEYVNLRSFTLDGNNVFKYLDFEVDTDSLYIGESAMSTVRAYNLDGTEIDASELDIRYTTSDADAATVSRSGKITALRDGKVTITVTVKHGNETHSASKDIELLDASGVKRAYLDAPESIYVTDRKKAKFKIEMNSGLVKEIDPSLVRFEVLNQNPDGVATIDSKGYISANAEGSITISANCWYDNARHTAEAITINLLPSYKKNKTTIYTQEMRDTAIENTAKYKWASDEVKAAKELADKYVDSYEKIYDSIAGKGLPTSRQIGGYGDPEYMICRYCGVDTSVFANGGNGRAFTWDIINRPWKIQCPGCKRLFPSNDFESFYNLGLDEHGLFDRDRALEKHEELFGGTYGTGYLKNNLYPELEETINNHRGLRPGETVETWAVDDGWGYIPRDENGEQYKYPNGKGERHPYIAYYVYSSWEQRRDILGAIRDAYIYTSDPKYGRAGAIILDRIADVWPEMETASYTGLEAGFFITDGGNFIGKTQGCIDDCVMATLFADCSDAFFPMTSDTQVINFLSREAEKHSLENKKESAYDIWSNWETGIIDAAYTGVKKRQIGGNFGQHQFVVTTAAVALDSQPKTNEMLDFVFKTGEETKTDLYGGNVASTLVDVISRDGMGNEASPQYNYVWIERLMSIADLLGRYPVEDKYNLWKNTKFVQMFMSYPPIAITSNESVQVGDCGQFGAGGFRALPEDFIPAFKYLRDTKNAKRIANYIYLLSGEETEGLHYDIMTKDPESLECEVESYLDSEMAWFTEILTGYGFGMLRSGGKLETVQNSNFKRGIYMNFGRSIASHGHKDALNIGITAYDLNMAPDLGYPSNTGPQPQRLQWISNTLSHNTIVVNEKPQTGIEHGYPQHFDDSGKVKLLDVDASGAYAETDIYRRTLVTVDIDDQDSYFVDFFRVSGGNDHLFSFHVAGDTVSETSLNLGEEQPGSYADPNWPYGEDPNSPAEYYYDTVYPRGYTWLKETRRAEGGNVGQYDVDFEIKDYKDRIKDDKGLHLRVTQLNDFELNEVALTTGHPPTNGTNKAVNEKGIKYLLARRTGENLDSLFTTVYEPYKVNRRLEGMTTVEIKAVDGTPGADDTAKAIKVIRETGRVDYIMYATNNSIKYVVTDGETKIDFRGFVGVYSVENGVNVYSYLNDGDILGEHTSEAAITGEVVDFSRDLSLDNYITVKPDNDVDASLFAGKMIVVDNDMVKNGAYFVESAEKLSDGNIRLDIGTVTAIRRYKDANDFDAGFIYNINPGQSFKIAKSFVEDSAPVFDSVSKELSASSGSVFTFSVNAQSEISDAISYEGTSIPRGASIDPESGKITWKPTAGQVGDNLFTITAYDEDGRYNSINFVVKVYGSTSGNTGGSGGGGGGGATAPTTPSDEKENDKDSETDVGEDIILPPAESDIRFIDLGSHAWAEDAINALAEDGIIRGTSETTYSPAKNITRADFALLLVRAFEKTSDNTENFDDVLDTDYFVKELAIARNTGLVGGIGDNKFAPRENIKRCDMMLMVYRVMKDTDTLVGADIIRPEYADYSDVPDYAKEAVSALISAGLVNGKNNLIAPLDNTTRAEVAVLLMRVLEFTKK